MMTRKCEDPPTRPIRSGRAACRPGASAEDPSCGAFERILRKIAPMKPHAQLCHEFAFVLHRPRREALPAETCRKCLDVDCQRAYAGRLGPRRRAIIGIGHHSSPLSRGKSPVREDGRIMPSRQRSTPIQTIEINRKSSDRRQIARNNPALGIMTLIPNSE